MTRLSTIYLSFFFSILTLTVEVFAQNQSERYWFVGGGANAVRFDQPSNTATLFSKTAVPYGTGGGAVATDATSGTLLFYTDGTNVYDINHAVMVNGSGLAGDPARSNPAVVTPIPGQPDMYYIFTNSAAGDIQFSIVDMTQGGAFPSPPTGVVDPAINQPIPALTGQAEGMIVIPHSNGTDYWLITQTAGTTDYNVTQVQASGVFTTTTYSNVGVSISAQSFAYHAANGQLAVAPQNPNTNVAILGFDDSSGALSFVQPVINSGVLSSAPEAAIYDMEWSPSGQYLYVSVHGDATAGPPSVAADVLQFDVTNPSLSPVSVLPQPPNVVQSYGLQMGPDSAIYHLYEAAGGEILMGKIMDTDTVATEVTYVPEVFPGTIDFNATQFPSFSPDPATNLTVSFTTSGTCTNTPINFFPSVSPAADSLVWDFGDGTIVNSWSPVHTFQNASSTVTVTAYLNGQTATASLPLNLTQFDLQLSLVQDTVACACELPVNNGEPTSPGAICPDDTSDDMVLTVQAQGGTGTPSYQWFGPGGALPGQTSTELRPDSAGYYYVIATLAGCSAYAGVNIREYDSLDQRANIWHFGNQAGIDFNAPYYNPGGQPIPIEGPTTAPEGVATISDRNGQVVFTTDGESIYDKNGDLLPYTLGGSPSSSQSALIVPVPGDETLFYIFTTQSVNDGTYELRYSIFDTKENPLGTFGGGLRDLDTSTPAMDASLVLYHRTTERLTGNNNWVISHDYGTNCFRAFQVTQAGLTGPVVSCLGSDHTTVTSAEGYMELGPQNILAVPLSTPGTSNVIELFDFVDSTGTVTNFRSIDVGSPEPDSQVYGIEFSGSKIFTTLKGGTNSHIVEMFLDSLSIPHIVDQAPIPPFPGELGAIQTGPDGRVYVAINNSASLGVINVNQDTTLNSTFDPAGFPLQTASTPTSTSSLGLPNFIQSLGNPTQGPGLNAGDGCVNEDLDFTASGKDPIIDQFDWQFGDGASATDAGPQISHAYTAPGQYTVVVRIYNKCEEVGTFSQQITIHDTPADTGLGLFTLCTGPVTIDANPEAAPNLSYAWSTGDTTQTITVSRGGPLNVTLTNEFGCTSTRAALVGDNRPVVNLPSDQTVCQNSVVLPLNAQNPGSIYQWEIDGVPAGTGQTQPVNTSTPGAFEYKVEVESSFFPGCIGSDSVVFTVNESPTIATNPIDATCGNADGRIELTINTPANANFTYIISGAPVPIFEIDQPTGTYNEPQPSRPILGFAAGSYGVTVTDQLTGCSAITTVGIADTDFGITMNRLTPCEPMDVEVTHTAPTPYNYRLIDAVTSQAVQSGTSSSAGSFIISGVNDGNYLIEISQGICTDVAGPQTITQDPQVAFNGFTSNICTDPLSIFADGGTSWQWTGPNITAGTDVQQTVTASPPPGTHTFNVTISEAGFCPLDTSITLVVEDVITPSIQTSDPCTDAVTVTATPTNSNFLYRWYVGAGSATPAPALGGPQVIATTTDNYRVEILSSTSGCVYSSPETPVSVIGELDISILPLQDQPCEGSPFTITTSPAPAGTTFTWTHNGTTINSTTSSSLIDDRAGLYTVTAAIATCQDEEQIQVTPAPVTAGLLNDEAIICDDPANTDPETNQVILRPGSGFASYNWFKNEVPIGITDSTLTVTEFGLYGVELVNVYGCSSYDETQVDRECTPKITGPNAFRPGGTNNQFFLFTFFIDDEDFQIFIFNRWGEMVYHSTDREFRWDGTYNNENAQLLPPGTYTYVVKYKSVFQPERGIQEKRGGVVLLR